MRKILKFNWSLPLPANGFHHLVSRAGLEGSSRSKCFFPFMFLFMSCLACFFLVLLGSCHIPFVPCFKLIQLSCSNCLESICFRIFLSRVLDYSLVCFFNYLTLIFESFVFFLEYWLVLPCHKFYRICPKLLYFYMLLELEKKNLVLAS